jgi:hypothetical protein
MNNGRPPFVLGARAIQQRACDVATSADMLGTRLPAGYGAGIVSEVIAVGRAESTDGRILLVVTPRLTRVAWFAAVAVVALSIAVILVRRQDAGARLRRAVFFGREEDAQRILENHPMSVNGADEQGLRDRSFAGIGFLRALESIARGPEHVFAEINALGFSALHVAAFKDDCVLGRLLLEKHANVNAPAAGGLTPLHIATLRGNVGMMQLLLTNNADVNAKDTHGWTALHVATGGRTNEVVILLEAGADRDIRDNAGRRPLDQAVALRNEQVVTVLKSGPGRETPGSR